MQETVDTQHPGGPEPGIYKAISFSEYQSWPYINNSTLTAGRRSMRHLLQAMSSRSEATDSMEFGTLCHSAILEPRYLHNRYCVMPDLTQGILQDDGTPYSNVRATKKYKEKLAQWELMETRICISQEQMGAAAAIVESVHSHPNGSQWLGLGLPKRPDTEVSLVWDDAPTGLRCKARLDLLWDDRLEITDVKTTADAMDFNRSIVKYGYHRQAAMYCDAVRTLRSVSETPKFNVIVAETTEPYGVRCAPMSPAAIETGRAEYRHLLNQLAKCIASNCWPGYSDPESWELPQWYGDNQQPFSLVIGGQRVAVE